MIPTLEWLPTGVNFLDQTKLPLKETLARSAKLSSDSDKLVRMIPTLEWLPTGVNFLDQTKLPLEETYVLATDYQQVATVIRDMIVRGAPAIGVSAAMGVAIGIDRSTATTLPALTAEVAVIARTLAETRPTAVNLFWGIDEVRNLYNDLAARNTPILEIKVAVVAKARRMYDEDIAACKLMGANGAALLPLEGTVLTHCNAGALATCGYGSALGVIRAAIERGHKINVFADETRPFLQGARLTAWELMKDNIPTTVLCDNMAAHLMSKGRIQAVIVGADRIAANGDTANKIGTYGVAILAKEFGIPFYVAAPWSTIDVATAAGDLIPIEQRSALEVTHSNGKQMTPHGVAIENPAFDVTPAKYITAIITERGVLRGPFAESIHQMDAQPAPELIPT
jgi:methylthioribose-1-phosphate isomerase